MFKSSKGCNLHHVQSASVLRQNLPPTAFMSSILSFPQGTFGREPQAKPEDDRYLRAAIQEYDNIAKLGQIMREGPIKVRHLCETSLRRTPADSASKKNISKNEARGSTDWRKGCQDPLV